MGFKENLNKLILTLIANEVRKEVPDFSVQRLNGLLRGQPPRKKELVALARVLKVLPLQLSSQTIENGEAADFAVHLYGNVEDGRKAERFVQFAQGSVSFRKGASHKDLETLALDFEEDDELATENEVFRLPKDERWP